MVCKFENCVNSICWYQHLSNIPILYFIDAIIWYFIWGINIISIGTTFHIQHLYCCSIFWFWMLIFMYRNQRTNVELSLYPEFTYSLNLLLSFVFQWLGLQDHSCESVGYKIIDRIQTHLKIYDKVRTRKLVTFKCKE